MKRSMLVLLSLLLSVVAVTATAADRMKNIEASMVVTGTIEVNPDGSVYTWALDQHDKVPPGVIALVQKTVPHWKFESVLVDGKAVLAKTRMALRIVALPTSDDDRFTAHVAGARFSKHAGVHEKVEKACKQCRRVPPGYPIEMIKYGVSGTVYLVVQIDREGKVVNAAARQVNLRVRMTPHSERIARKQFAEVSIDAARKWTFAPDQSGDDTPDGTQVVMVPINFTLSGERVHEAAGYGQWDVYIPGPVQTIPWADEATDHVASNGSADSIPNNGQPFVEDTRFVLLTPIGSGADAAQTTEQSGQG